MTSSPFQTRRTPPRMTRSPQRSSLSRGIRGSFLSWWSAFSWLQILLSLFVVGAILVFFTALYYLRGIPSIADLINNPPGESTVIYDRENNPIYTIFEDGKRTYVEYEEISQYMRDAIISIEDKTFFTNPGIDLRGLAGAIFGYVTGQGQLRGASTISQQLVKNTLLTNERSMKRKIQEAVLSYRLNNQLSKEKILELYLNTISFGNNASGVEEAAKTYFGKGIKDVGPLGATILASLPKAPTNYSPYLHRDRLMGYTMVISQTETTKLLETTEKEEFSTLYKAFKSYIDSLVITREEGSAQICQIKPEYQKTEKYPIDDTGCISVDYEDMTGFLSDISIPASDSDEPLVIEYTFGRKDVVAMNMLEDGKLTGDEYKGVLLNGLDYVFNRMVTKMDHPYFVFYIKEYLEETYGKDIDISKGLKVYTTLDPQLQTKAEEIVRKQVAINKAQYGASSAALISIDNETGEILAMVGGPNYWDEVNGGNNNMTTAKREPGSSFKPIVYALAISKYPIGPESPVADTKTTFPGGWTPNNYDEKFKGIMSLRNALAYSRNIPAAKIFFLAGQEEEIEKYARSLGIDSLPDAIRDGAPLSLGTAAVRPIEMASAYSTFANNGVKKKITGIRKIEDSADNVIEELKENTGEAVMNPAAAYIIGQILSDNDARPASDFWRNALTLKDGRKAAAKTGTSNKDVSKGGVKKILPRDLWTIGYTPQITTVVWAGNVNGKEAGSKADGLTCAAPIWRAYMDAAHAGKKKLEFTRPEGVYDVSISRVTGRLASKDTPAGAIRKTIMAVKPTEYESGVKAVQVDKLCNGPVTSATPESDIITIYSPKDKPIIDGYDPKWTDAFFAAARVVPGGEVEISTTPCDRPTTPGGVIASLAPAHPPVKVGKNLIIASWQGDRPIQSLRLLDGATVLYETTFTGEDRKSTHSLRTMIDFASLDVTLSLEITDTYGFVYHARWSAGGAPESSQEVTLSGSDTIPSTPVPQAISTQTRLRMSSPTEGDMTKNIYQGDTFNLRFAVESATEKRDISVSLDGREIYSATVGDRFVVPISSAGLEVGDHRLMVQLLDANMKTDTRSVTVTVLAK